MMDYINQIQETAGISRRMRAGELEDVAAVTRVLFHLHKVMQIINSD
jgi:hypothetical protein